MLHVPLWLDPVCYSDLLLCSFSSQTAFCSSCYCELFLAVEAALFSLLSEEWGLFSWINKLMLPALSSCLFVSHLHVTSHDLSWSSGGWLCRLCFWLRCSLRPVTWNPFRPFAYSVISCWWCVWLLWQDSKWVEEKQYLIRTNQELHEKVDCAAWKVLRVKSALL